LTVTRRDEEVEVPFRINSKIAGKAIKVEARGSCDGPRYPVKTFPMTSIFSESKCSATTINLFTEQISSNGPWTGYLYGQLSADFAGSGSASIDVNLLAGDNEIVVQGFNVTFDSTGNINPSSAVPIALWNLLNAASPSDISADITSCAPSK
jgi:hypothetical protein